VQPRFLWVLAFGPPALFASCSTFHVDSGSPSDGGGEGSVVIRHDAASLPDAPLHHEASKAADAAREAASVGETGTRDSPPRGADAGHDAPFDTGRPTDASGRADADASSSEGGISPLLALPPLDGATCTPVGSQVVCNIGMCLIVNATNTGRCQECRPQGSCGGNLHDSCQTADDCDSLFACYAGQCDLMCPFDASGYCGSVPCTNVGNPFQGVCVPSE
jgi:hypothetical protein